MMRLFIIEKIKALLFIIFATFSFISLISFSSTDPGINFVGDNNEIANIMGLFGAYFSSILYTFLGYSSFLLPIFFIIHGFISLIKNKSGAITIKLIVFLLGIIFLNYSIYILDNSFSLLGIFLNDIISSFIEQIFNSNFLIQIISSVLGLISILMIMYSFNISLKYFSKSFQFFYSIIIIIMLPIRLILTSIKKFKYRKINHNLPINKKNNKRKVEPTILKGFKNKTIFSKQSVSQKYLLL